MKKFRHILIFLFCISYCSLSRGQGPDRAEIALLLKTLSACPKDTNRVSMLSRCAYLLSRTEPKTGLTYAKEAVRLAEELNWQRGLAIALDNTALCDNVLEDSANARICAERSLAIARNINDTACQVMALTKLGYVAYRAQFKRDEARAYGQQALGLAQKINDRQTRAFAYMHMGFLLDKKKEFNDAVHFDSLAIALFDTLNDRYSQAGAYCNLGIEYSMKHEYARKLEFDSIALALLAPYDSSEYRAITLICQSDSYYQLHNYTRALASCLEALAIDTRLDKKSIMADDHERAAMAYYKLGRYEEALRQINAGMELEMTVGDFFGRWGCRRIQKRILKKMT